jgi:peroxiredoxin family protein
VPKEIFPEGRSETRTIYSVISVYYMVFRVMFWEQKEICWNDVQKPNNEKQRQKMSKIMTSLEASQSSTGPNKINRLRAQYLSATFQVGACALSLRVFIPLR